ncbi:MAG: N-acetylmuramoyl-L-alanine amidase [Synergistaceae bacterium]|nr:N-acetylmuramoyl-L-alanine amidase [Synergistaceae bacterium]
MKIVIDPGHGAPDSGAVGPTGTREADINLKVAHALAKELAARGHIASLTRSGTGRLYRDDRAADLRSRPAFANRTNASCFISLHCNAAANSAAQGFEVYTTRGRDRSDPLAAAIFEAWNCMFPQQRKRADMSDGDADKESDFVVLRTCNVPAVLIEMGFISNPEEERFLLAPDNHEKIAAAISNGLEAWNDNARNA